jgi:antitoxin (DNA-binding transcriptional repressor) of toxin-antitoxin stability system
MRRAQIADLKNNLSRYLDHVRAGGTVVVLHRDRAVAKIVPLGAVVGPDDDRARIATLERHGLARPGTAGSRRWVKTLRPVRVAGGSLVQALLEERRGGW